MLLLLPSPPPPSLSQRDLLADETSTRKLGDKTPGLTPVIDAELENQKERVSTALNRASSETACVAPLEVVEVKRGTRGEQQGLSSAVTRRGNNDTGDIVSTEDAPGLAVFLSNVLRGLRVEKEEEEEEEREPVSETDVVADSKTQSCCWYRKGGITPHPCTHTLVVLFYCYYYLSYFNLQLSWRSEVIGFFPSPPSSCLQILT